MGALTRLLPAVLLLVATPAKADQVARWRPIIEEASTRFGIPTVWIERVMRAESRGMTTRDGRPIRSRAGAMGLMQLMPKTWQEMRLRLGLGDNPDAPRDNILAGTFYLRLMYDRFGYPGLFGAYNAGPAAYSGWLKGARRLPGETVAYLEAVAGTKQITSAAIQTAPPPSLFILRRASVENHAQPSAHQQQASLFAIRNVMP